MPFLILYITIASVQGKIYFLKQTSKNTTIKLSVKSYAQ